MSRSSSGSGLRAGRVGVGWDEPLPDVDAAPDPGVAPEVLGPWVGQECWVPGAVGEAGVCGADCGTAAPTGPCGPGRRAEGGPSWSCPRPDGPR